MAVKSGALRRPDPRPPGPREALRNDLPQLDRLIHERLRLGIVSALAAAPKLAFAELKEMLDVTDGNLSVHARKLEDAGYIRCAKSFVGRVPKSEYSLTGAGRQALERYLNHMEALVRAFRAGQPARSGEAAK
jgi:DNA-binding MarR family transcriptional regulator